MLRAGEVPLVKPFGPPTHIPTAASRCDVYPLREVTYSSSRWILAIIVWARPCHAENVSICDWIA